MSTDTERRRSLSLSSVELELESVVEDGTLPSSGRPRANSSPPVPESQIGHIVISDSETLTEEAVPDMTSPALSTTDTEGSRLVRGMLWRSYPKSGRCLKCNKQYARLQQHIRNLHQGDFTVEEANAIGWQICACGHLCRKPAAHWAQGCRLPPEERRVLAPEDLNPVTPPVILPNQAASPIQRLFEVLNNDHASEAEVEEGYEVLAGLPGFSRLWLPAESRLINRRVSWLADRYLLHQRPVDLLRILALPKVACNPRMTFNKLGNLQRRLASYPYLSDALQFEDRVVPTGQSRGRADCSVQVHRLLQRGKVGAAARLLRGTMGVAEVNEATLRSLQALHPVEREHVEWNDLSHNSRNRARPLKVPAEAVTSAVFRTSPETSGGPSGFDGRLIYILRYNEAFLGFLTRVANRIADGSMHLRHLLIGARVVPLKKNDRGGLRPVAVGEIVYRVAAKAVLQQVQFSLLPFQLGVKTKLGVEPIVHLLGLKGPNSDVISLDIKNAFNSIRRDYIHSAVRARAPTLVPAFEWSYGCHSSLYVGGRNRLVSSSGVRQGDPLAPLLFSLGYSQLLVDLQARLESQALSVDLGLVCYLDDSYVVVPRDGAQRAMRVIQQCFDEKEASSGLSLNQDKTMLSTPEMYRAEGLSLLGAHIGPGTDSFVSQRIREWGERVQLLQSLPLQDGYQLLRQALLPELAHLQRCTSPSPEIWKEADEVLSQVVRQVVARFDHTSFEANLVSLPTRLGGLSLPFPASTAHLCAAASESQCWELLKRLEPNLVVPTHTTSARSQKDRLHTHWKQLQLSLLQRLPPESKRLFVDNSSTVGSRWLRALPTTQSMTLSDRDFAAGLCHRLLLFPETCRACHAEVLSAGHGEHCTANSGLWQYRHDSVKGTLEQCFREAGADVTTEERESSSHGRIDLTVSSQLLGGTKAFDLSVCAVTGVAAEESVGTSVTPGEVDDGGLNKCRRTLQLILHRRHLSKLRAHASRSYRGSLETFLVTTGGTFHSNTSKLLARLKRQANPNLSRLLYELSVALTRFRARAYQRSCTPTVRVEEHAPRHPRRPGVAIAVHA